MSQLLEEAARWEKFFPSQIWEDTGCPGLRALSHHPASTCKETSARHSSGCESPHAGPLPCSCRTLGTRNPAGSPRGPRPPSDDPEVHCTLKPLTGSHQLQLSVLGPQGIPGQAANRQGLLHLGEGESTLHHTPASRVGLRDDVGDVAGQDRPRRVIVTPGEANRCQGKAGGSGLETLGTGAPAGTACSHPCLGELRVNLEVW